MTTQPRIVTWRAVSTDDQAERESLHYQKELNAQHVAKLGGIVIADLLVDGESRNIDLWEDACKSLNAFSELNRLLRGKERKFDILMCQDFTRVARTLSLATAVAALCERAGVRIYECTSPPSNLNGPISTPDSRLLMLFKGHQSEQEIRKFNERSLFGRQAQVRKGKHANTPPVGYKRVYNEQNGEVIVVKDSEWEPHVKLFYDMYLNHGISLRGIAREFNARGIQRLRGKSEWDITSIMGFLRNRWVYAGYSCWGQRSKNPDKGFRVKAEWEPIITEEMARWAEREMKVRAGAPRSAGSPRLFSLMAECGYCGSRVSCHKVADGKRKAWQRGTTTYICSKQCAGSHVREPVMIDAVREQILRLVDAAHLESLINETPTELISVSAELEGAKNRLEQVTRERANLTRAYTRETITIDEYEALMAELKERYRQLSQTIMTLEKRLAESPNASQQRTTLEEIRDMGLGMLNHPDKKIANAWLRRHFKLVIADNKVAAIVLKTGGI